MAIAFRLPQLTASVVAVKVRHPDVKESIELDFELMNFFVSSTEKLIRFLNKGKSSLASAQIKESLMQFGAPMREQIDLRSEAKHLESFAENFKWWWARVRFPMPSSMVSEDVLVESFETGDHISEYLDKESTHNASLANLGLKTYLKMLIHDNLIHADLHPGNILVHLDSPQEGTFLKTVADLLKLDIEIPRIVLLDVGMTTRLTDAEQGNLVEFFDTLTRMDGQRIAESILSFADAVDDATGFKREMHVLFEKLEPEQLRKNTQAIIGDMMVGIGTSTGTRSLFARPDSLTRATRFVRSPAKERPCMPSGSGRSWATSATRTRQSGSSGAKDALRRGLRRRLLCWSSRTQRTVRSARLSYSVRRW